MSSQPPRPSTRGNSDSSRPLPRGRHGLPFQLIVESQRRRLIAGTAKALAEHRYAELTVKHVIEAAGVSCTTFYANFDNKRDCVLAAHRDVFKRLEQVITVACDAEHEWPQSVQAAVAAAFAFAAAAPEEARLLSLDAVAAELELSRAVIASNARLAALLRDGRRRTPHGPELPELLEEFMIGSASAILGRSLLDRDSNSLQGLEPEVVQLLLTPYLGIQEAARVARSSE